MNCRRCNKDMAGRLGHICPDCRLLVEAAQECPLWLRVALVVVAFGVPVGEVSGILVMRIGGQ